MKRGGGINGRDDFYKNIFFSPFLCPRTMIRMQDMVFAVYRTEGRREELRENDIT
jgi:hypothetical protein